MKEKLFCNKCGRQNTTEDKFCPGCGNELSVELNQDTQADNLEKPMDVTKKSEKKKTGIIPGIILITIGVLYLISFIVNCLGNEKNSDELILGVPALGIGFCIFGSILIKRRFKKYGWGIGAIFMGSVVINGIYPFDKSQLIGSLILLAICGYFFVKANIKKEVRGEK